MIDSFTLKVKGFFTKGHSRTLVAKRNIAAALFIKGGNILVNLILVPITINYVNPTQYGIWLTLSSIITWLSFFDIGFGNGLRNKFAEAKALGNQKKARIYVSTTYAVLSIIFSLVWIIFFCVNHFLDWSTILNTPTSMKGELSVLALMIFSFFCVQMVLKTINTVLIADQKSAKSALFDLGGQLLLLVSIIILMKVTKGSLIYLGFTFGLAPIIVLIGSSLFFYNTKYKHVAPSFKFVRLRYAKDIMKLGMKFFVIQIAVIVIYETSNIVITQVSGPADVTTYNIVYKYFGIATMIFSILIAPFWSAFTDAFSTKDYEWMRKTVSQLRKVSFILIGIVILMFVVSDIAFKLWVGNTIVIRRSISLIMAIYVATNIWNFLHSSLLNGMGKIKLQLYVSLIGTVLNIPMAIFFGRRFGIEGVILSALLLNIVSAMYAPIQVNKLLNQRAKGIWNE